MLRPLLQRTGELIISSANALKTSTHSDPKIREFIRLKGLDLRVQGFSKVSDMGSMAFQDLTRQETQQAASDNVVSNAFLG